MNQRKTDGPITIDDAHTFAQALIADGWLNDSLDCVDALQRRLETFLGLHSAAATPAGKTAIEAWHTGLPLPDDTTAKPVKANRPRTNYVFSSGDPNPIRADLGNRRFMALYASAAPDDTVVAQGFGGPITAGDLAELDAMITVADGKRARFISAALRDRHGVEAEAMDQVDDGTPISMDPDEARKDLLTRVDAAILLAARMSA